MFPVKKTTEIALVHFDIYCIYNQGKANVQSTGALFVYSLLSVTVTQYAKTQRKRDQKERGHFKGFSNRQAMVHIWTVESLPVAPWWAGCRTAFGGIDIWSPSPGIQHSTESHFILCLLTKQWSGHTRRHLTGGLGSVIILTWGWKYIESALMVWAFSFLHFHNLHKGLVMFVWSVDFLAQTQQTD